MLFKIWQTSFLVLFFLMTLSPVSAQKQVKREKVDLPQAGRQVLNGIDVLVRDDFRQLQGRNIGLISNHTGRDLEGCPTAELLYQSKVVNLKAIFSPEHGYSGTFDQSIVKGGTDQGTGVKIFSLYGKTRIPLDKDLQGIDTIVFDIQDIGSRFYTYISTMGLAMRKAAERKIRFVVLDRPNPISGSIVQGPVLGQGEESFVGCHTLPIRHGMTVGELALLLKKEWNLELDLKVIKIEGWDRTSYFDRCGQLWINPSPNMRNLNQATLYPGIGILETTNLSVGRGTDCPFEWIGAPWIDARKLAAEINQQNIPGVRVVPVSFTPISSKYKNKRCFGVNFVITNREKFHPIRLGFETAIALNKLHPKQWNTKSLNRLISNRLVTGSIMKGEKWNDIQKIYLKDLTEFKKRRQTVLLY